MVKDSREKKEIPVSQRNFFRRFPILANLLVMVVISLVIIISSLFLFDTYTLHNKSITIPKVENLPIDKAVTLLEESNLSYEVVDSVFTLDKTPGTVLDIVPFEGSTVKPHRTVYLTVVARGKPQQSIPTLENLSMRQAKATLEALGFTSLSIRYIPGDFPDLVQYVSATNGGRLTPGQKVSIDTPLTLVVSSNIIDIPDSLRDDEEWGVFLGDSIQRKDSLFHSQKQEGELEVMEGDESWF